MNEGQKIEGVITTNPELSYTSEGQATNFFLIKTNPDTIFIQVYNQLAEVSQKYIQKGCKIRVEGPLTTRNNKLFVTAKKIYFLGKEKEI